MKKTITIDGSNFYSLDSFYHEVENKLTKNLDWQIGRNLDAFNDILRGGFGIYEYEEPITLIWENSIKSENEFSWEETIKYISKKLSTCHPLNIDHVKADLELANKNKGKTLFAILIDIIKEHNHIELHLR